MSILKLFSSCVHFDKKGDDEQTVLFVYIILSKQHLVKTNTMQK